jgi:hypothetical protein
MVENCQPVCPRLLSPNVDTAIGSVAIAVVFAEALFCEEKKEKHDA